jgi:hypothetical protein
MGSGASAQFPTGVKEVVAVYATQGMTLAPKISPFLQEGLVRDDEYVEVQWTGHGSSFQSDLEVRAA